MSKLMFGRNKSSTNIMETQTFQFKLISIQSGRSVLSSELEQSVVTRGTRKPLVLVSLLDNHTIQVRYKKRKNEPDVIISSSIANISGLEQNSSEPRAVGFSVLNDSDSDIKTVILIAKKQSCFKRTKINDADKLSDILHQEIMKNTSIICQQVQSPDLEENNTHNVMATPMIIISSPSNQIVFVTEEGQSEEPHNPMLCHSDSVVDTISHGTAVSVEDEGVELLHRRASMLSHDDSVDIITHGTDSGNCSDSADIISHCSVVDEGESPKEPHHQNSTDVSNAVMDDSGVSEKLPYQNGANVLPNSDSVDTITHDVVVEDSGTSENLPHSDSVDIISHCSAVDDDNMSEELDCPDTIDSVISCSDSMDDDVFMDEGGASGELPSQSEATNMLLDSDSADIVAEVDTTSCKSVFTLSEMSKTMDDIERHTPTALEEVDIHPQLPRSDMTRTEDRAATTCEMVSAHRNDHEAGSSSTDGISSDTEDDNSGSSLPFEPLSDRVPHNSGADVSDEVNTKSQLGEDQLSNMDTASNSSDSVMPTSSPDDGTLCFQFSDSIFYFHPEELSPDESAESIFVVINPLSVKTL